MRAAPHHAEATALSPLRQGNPPGPEEREMPCLCGQKARYREMRWRKVLTVVGEIGFQRAWYLCPHCHHGQFPADAALDIGKQDCRPAYAACWR
jgi:hypothetical protein